MLTLNSGYTPFLSALLNLHSHQQSILITLVSLLIYLLLLPFGGLLADKIGVKKQLKIASICYLLFSYVVFALIPHLDLTQCLLVLILFVTVQALLNSALPAYIVGQFLPNQRGKALAISYNMSLTLFAALMPFLIVASGNHLNPGIPISICAVLSLSVLNYKGRKYGYLRSKPSY